MPDRKSLLKTRLKKQSYVWEENSSSGSCSIRIQHWFFENHGIAGAGLIWFEAYADAVPAALPKPEVGSSNLPTVKLPGRAIP
jgi:hypothetical protein